MQAYSDPRRGGDPFALPNLEIFFINEGDENFAFIDENEEDEEGNPLKVYLHKGWYYWHCFPGCMPESEPIGPFDSEEDALEDARILASAYDNDYE